MTGRAGLPGGLRGSDAPECDAHAGAGLGSSRDELVARHAHLVKYVVGRLGVSVPGLFDHEDAMQAGALGLLRAIDAYKPEAAASFQSYAILRIRGAILDAVRSLDSAGRAGREAARAIQAAIRDLQHELGRSPSESEIAARLGLPVARYRERLQAASVVKVSFDEHDGRDNDDEWTTLADSAPDPNAVDPAEEAARRDGIASLVQKVGRLGQRTRTGPRPLLPGRVDVPGDRPGPGRDRVSCVPDPRCGNPGSSQPVGGLRRGRPTRAAVGTAMIRGFYAALSGVVSSETRQAVVADNIANSTSYLIGSSEAATSCPGLIATGG